LLFLVGKLGGLVGIMRLLVGIFEGLVVKIKHLVIISIFWVV